MIIASFLCDINIIYQYRQNNHKNANENAIKIADKGICNTGLHSVGDGSVMDCSKCIAPMVLNTGDIWVYSLSSQGGAIHSDLKRSSFNYL